MKLSTEVHAEARTMAFPEIVPMHGTVVRFTLPGGCCGCCSCSCSSCCAAVSAVRNIA